MAQFTRRKAIRWLLLALLVLFLIRTLTANISFKSYSDLPKPRVFVAANFYNNEEVLPNFEQQLLSLIDFLGKDKVFVSIYENGSKDNTKALLNGLRDQLDQRGVGNVIITSPDQKSFIRRIPYLARLRNLIVQPMIDLYKENHTTYDKIIFFNDVVFHFHDLLELLYTKHLNYDAVCAMDFYYQFYDFFATRDIEGKSFGSGYFPFVDHPASRSLIWNRQPFLVQSCWNGIAVYNPEPFLKGVQFRGLQPEKDRVYQEASECCLINVDLRQMGYDRIFINPEVRVAYSWRFYYLQTMLIPWLHPILYLGNSPDSQSFWTRIKKERGGTELSEAQKLQATPEEQLCVQ